MPEEAFRLAHVRICIYNDGRRTEEILGYLSPEESEQKMKRTARILAADFARWREARMAEGQA